MTALALLAALVTGSVELTVTWEPPTVYDPPAMEWADRCVPPTGAVVVGVSEPIQYRVEATNDHGWSGVWIAGTNRLATVRLPVYDAPAVHRIVVIGEYADAPHESEPSCELVHETDAVRPAPTGLRIVGAEATFGPGEPVARLTLEMLPPAPAFAGPLDYTPLPAPIPLPWVQPPGGSIHDALLRTDSTGRLLPSRPLP